MESTSDSPPMTMIEDDDEILAEGGNEEDERFGYCYYRLPTGWITQARADPASIESYRKKGMEALVADYGRFVFNPAIIKDRRGNALPQWQPYFQPYDMLLLKAPEEFPVEQVVAYHWHRGIKARWIEYLADGRYRTHSKTVTFPQMAGIDVPDHVCMICGRAFTAPQHLNQHTRVAHPEQGTILKLAETQQAIATAITVAQGKGGDSDVALAGVLQQIVATQQQMGEVLQAVLNQNQRRERTEATRNLTQRAARELYEESRSQRPEDVVTEEETPEDEQLHSSDE